MGGCPVDGLLFIYRVELVPIKFSKGLPGKRFLE
jgi:hypothetical protein